MKGKIVSSSHSSSSQDLARGPVRKPASFYAEKSKKQGEKETEKLIFFFFNIRDWLSQLWKLKSSMSGSWPVETGPQESRGYQLQCETEGRSSMSQLKDNKAERANSSFSHSFILFSPQWIG